MASGLMVIRKINRTSPERPFYLLPSPCLSLLDVSTLIVYLPSAF